MGRDGLENEDLTLEPGDCSGPVIRPATRWADIGYLIFLSVAALDQLRDTET